MPIDITEDRNNAPTTPVMKRTAIAERTRLAIVRFEQRPIKRDGNEVINPKTGKARQELVVHGIVMEGTTAPCGKGDDQWVPEVGTPVRVILKGGGFGAWIEARKTHRNGSIRVGDELRLTVEYAQAYDSEGDLRGGQIIDQADVVTMRMKGVTLGFYGPLKLVEGSDATAIATAEKAYLEATAITLDTPKVTVTEEPW
jgi:hypothetical protein